MSAGRYIMRGRVFQGRAFAPWALAAAAAEITDPNEGWIANNRTRLAVSEPRDRLAISGIRNRLWIAKGKAQ